MSTVQRDIHANMRGILVDWLVEVALVSPPACSDHPALLTAPKWARLQLDSPPVPQLLDCRLPEDALYVASADVLCS